MSFNQPTEAEIFDRARSLQSADARREYLDQVCSDPELRRRIERLLAEDQEDDFLEVPVMGDFTVDRPMERAGTTIGPYKLLEVIGEGGMGTVYLAQQFEPVKRRVAVKLVKPGIASSDVVARFEVERQALALMEHPNIAKFYDAGETPTGPPYFVMEFVAGMPVTKYCDEKRLSIEERLKLLRKICQAVQHAHQKGIMHRDLKPSNILITTIDDQPVPKIIDFGLAKAAGAQLTDATLLTNFGQVLGTLQYMSPEQTRSQGEDIDTRTDIYSLGAILYELLVGSPPFEVQSFKERAFDEVLRMIREEDPPTPNKRLISTQTNSEVADQRQLNVDKMNRLVKGDLEWIVMRSLEKDRARRYQTADALADDIHRFIEFRPVEARAPSLLYRTQKFLRRNRVGVIVVSSVIITGLVGITVGLWQIAKTRQIARVQGLVNSLVTSQIEEVPRIIDQLAGYGQIAESYVQQARQSTEAESPERLRAELAQLNLANTNNNLLVLKGFILEGRPSDIQVIRSEVEGDWEGLSEELWTAVAGTESATRLLNIASVLALHDQDNPGWKPVSDRIVDALLQTDPFSAPLYIEMLAPIGEKLRGSLFNVLASSEETYTPSKRDLVASIADKYFRDDANQIIDFILESEPSQFRILVGSLYNNRNAAITRLKRELESEPQPSWNDQPLNPAWTEPGESDIQAIVEAGGMVKERFALCQNMPLDEFTKVSESLRTSGYRPTRCRPYNQNDSVLVAAVWTRDDLDWKLFYGQTRKQFEAGVEGIRKQGFQPIDVARYVDRKNKAPDSITSVWVQKNDKQGDTMVILDQVTDQTWERILPRGFNFQLGIHRNYDSLGQMQRAYTILADPTGGGAYFAQQTVPQFRAAEKRYQVHWDVCLSSLHARESSFLFYWSPRAVKLSDPNAPFRARHEEQLKLANHLLDLDPNNLKALRDRAIANHCLRRDEEAILDLTRCISADSNDVYLTIRRAISSARAGNAKQGWADLETLKQANDRLSSPDLENALQAILSFYLADPQEGFDRLDDFVANNPELPRAGYLAAHAYAEAAKYLQNRNTQKSREYALRAIELIDLSFEKGAALTEELLLQIPEFESIRGMDEFEKLIQKHHDVARLDLRIDTQWRHSAEFESTAIIEPNPSDHHASAMKLVETGFRPRGISGLYTDRLGSIHTASVWHRPKVASARLDANAKRKFKIALALIQIGAGDIAWPKLAYDEQLRLRSWMICRVAECGISSGLIFERLQVERNPGIRQALILMLGEVNNWNSAPNEIRDYLLELFENDPDSAIHSATEWTLRQHQLHPDIEKIQDRLSGQATSTSQNWYVTKTGLTMIEVDGPVEFVMGGRTDYHRQRISRSFAIASKELTRRQLDVLQAMHPETQLSDRHYELDPSPGSSEDACGGLTWVNAAKICRLLSELEGIPEDQMCFPPIDQINENMVLPKDYLLRTGYRIPTQAEWEYTARSGTTSDLPFGNSKNLLAEFGWFAENGRGIPNAVGTLKPNEFGLFDTIGNVSEFAIHFSNYRYGLSKDRLYDDNSRIPFTQPWFVGTKTGADFFNWHREIQTSMHFSVKKLESHSTFGIRVVRSLESEN